MKIERVIEECLVAIYNEDIFNETLFLKGGQALRFAENNDTRLSTDIDFSVEKGIDNPKDFFSALESTIVSHFDNNGFHIFDFTFIRRPEIQKEGIPDYWSGWEVNFKIIEGAKKILPLDKKRREAIWPEGADRKKIHFDISQYEYCGSIQKVVVGGSIVRSYSRALLVLEKLRALCQQHPEYQIKGTKFRARDYYDISQLIYKYTVKGEREALVSECKVHMNKVFEAKEVSLDLLSKIVDENFSKKQSENWELVVRTISGDKEPFKFYVGNVKKLIEEILGQ